MEFAYLPLILLVVVLLRYINEWYDNWSIKRRILKLAKERNLDPATIISYKDLPHDELNNITFGWKVFLENLKNLPRLYEWFLERAKSKKLGTVCYTMFPLRKAPLIQIHNPELIEYILKTNFYNFEKGDLFRSIFHDFLGEGIFASDGANWKQQRASASHLFSVKELKSMVDVFVKHGHSVVEILSSHIGQVIDVQDLFQRYTLDSFGEIALGVGIGSLHSADVPFAVAFDKINTNSFFRFSNPFWKVARRFPILSKNEQALNQALKYADEFVYSIIQQRKSETSLDKEDLISLYLRLIKPTIDDPHDKHLRDFVMNFVIAGRDTTAALLTFTFYELARNPLILDRLIEEVDSTLHGKLPDYESIKNMKYLKAVLDETLRLYPPVPLNGRNAYEDDIFPNNVFIPKGSRCGYSLYVIGRLEEYWDNPLCFDPERFLDKSFKNNLFMPFHWGQRLCLGQNMAYIEAKILVCMILQKFKVTDAPENLSYTPSATLRATKMTLRVLKNK